MSESTQTTNKVEEKTPVLHPSARMKKLVEMSHDISIDKDVSISKYFNSGRELIKAAAALENKGDIERAFVLYLRYMTLFLEKIVHHPEYTKADRAEKTLVKKECNNVFELAECLKKRILEKYTLEYEQSQRATDPSPTSSDSIQKRSIQPQSANPPPDCDVDEIDRKFDFSQQPHDGQPGREFDPFNVEQLKQSFNNA